MKKKGKSRKNVYPSLQYYDIEKRLGLSIVVALPSKFPWRLHNSF